MAININLDVIMAQRRAAVGDLADRVGITAANLSILKNNKAKAIRFSTLAALCRELGCQPGDILQYTDEGRGQWELARTAETKEGVDERSEKHDEEES